MPATKWTYSISLALIVLIMLATGLPAGAHNSNGPFPTAYALGRSQEETGDGKTSQTGLPLALGGIIVLIVVGRRLLLLSGEKQAHATAGDQASYGLAGGAICARCGRAFARQALSPNLIVGKLSRCPHCGKWSIAPRATPAALAAAEAAHKPASEPTESVPSGEERLRRQIEASKYE